MARRMTLEEYRKKNPDYTQGKSDFDLTHELWLHYGQGKDYYEFSQELMGVPKTPEQQAALSPPDRSPKPKPYVEGPGLAGDDEIGHLEYMGLKGHASWDYGWASIFQGADDIADMMSNTFFGENSTLFEDTAKYLFEKADELDKIADQHDAGFAEEVIAEAVGGAVPGILEFMGNVPWAVLREAAANYKDPEKNGVEVVTGAVTAGLKRYVLGRIFGVFGRYGKPVAMAGNATVFSAETALAGGDRREVAKAAATGVLYGLLHNKKVEKGVKDTRVDLRNETHTITPEAETPAELSIRDTDNLVREWEPFFTKENMRLQDIPDPESRAQIEAMHAVHKTAMSQRNKIVQELQIPQMENNASGESTASFEAISRVRSEKARVIRYWYVDNGGNILPIPAGVDAVDLVAPPGKSLWKSDPNGVTLLDQGKGSMWGVDKRFDVLKKTLEHRAEESPKTVGEVGEGESMEPLSGTAQGIAFSVTREYLGALDPNTGEPIKAFEPSKALNLRVEKWDTLESARYLAQNIAESNKKMLQDRTQIKKPLAVTERQMHAKLEEIVGSAQDTKALLKEARKVRKTLEDMDAEVGAWKTILASHTERLDQLMKDAASITGTDLDLLKAYHKLDFVRKLQAEVAGMQSGGARITTAARITISGREIAIKDITPELAESSLEVKIQVEEAIKKLGGKEELQRLYADWEKQTDFKGRMRYIRKMRGNKFLNALIEFRATNMLSSIKTQIVNFTSNVGHLTVDTVDNYVAAAIGTMRKGERLTFQEANVRAHSIATGLLNGFVLDPYKGIKEIDLKEGNRLKRLEEWAETRGVDPYVRSQSEGMVPSAMSKEYLRGVTPDSSFGDIGWRLFDQYGRLSRFVSFGLMNISDSTIKTVTYDAEVRGLFFREAMRRGIERDKVAQWIETQKTLLEELRKGTPVDTNEANLQLVLEVHKQSLKKARYIAWQEEMSPGAMKRIEQALKETPALRLLIPFYKTPMNLLRQVPRRIPGFHLWSKEVRADIEAGGIRASQAYARMFTGVATLGFAGALYASGKLIGGVEKEESETFRNAGIPEYSIYLGPSIGFVQYNRYDPVGTFLGLTADLSNLGERAGDMEYDDILYSLVAIGANNIFNKTWATTLSDLSLTIKDPDRYGKSFLEKYRNTLLVPLGGLARSVQEYTDPLVRDTSTYLDTLKATYLPGVAPAKRDDFGKVVPRYSPVLGSSRMKPRTDSPVRMEMAYLHIPGKPRIREVFGVEVTPEQEREILRILDEELKAEDVLNEIVTGAGYPKEVGLRKKVLMQVRNELWRAAIATYFSRESGIQKRLVQKKQDDVADMLRTTDKKGQEASKNWKEFVTEGR